MLRREAAFFPMNEEALKPAFAAALLAGGRSRRMGTDKAFVPWQGLPLWEHQMEKLTALGANELLLSCRKEQVFPAFANIIRVEDKWPDAGPLGGVGSCLSACTAPLLVVLGIDLPLMPREFLQHLIHESTPECGAVVVSSGGEYYEPLAAVYPRAMSVLAEEQIAAGRLSMQGFIRLGVEAGLLRVPALPLEREWFTNVNTPEDARSGMGESH
jgi:molybdenum cofactor guanylyltransferase